MIYNISPVFKRMPISCNVYLNLYDYRKNYSRILFLMLSY